MKWKLKEVSQETSHPFLNYFTLTYEVDGKSDYKYFLASRHNKNDLLPCTHNLDKPDGVLILLYYLDNEGKASFLLTKQFRPAMGTYVYSMPAGLMDESDENIIEVAKREALEEAGANIEDIEIISEGGPTSSGLSDETNAIVLARITSFDKQKLEEYEDIQTKLVSRDEALDLLKRKDLFFSNAARLAIMYLSLRFDK